MFIDPDGNPTTHDKFSVSTYRNGIILSVLRVNIPTSWLDLRDLVHSNTDGTVSVYMFVYFVVRGYKIYVIVQNHIVITSHHHHHQQSSVAFDGKMHMKR